MIIEFNGLPGTGKTTVAQALKSHLDGQYNVWLKYTKEESRLKRYISYLFDGSIRLFLLGYRYSKYSGKCYKRSKLKYIGLLIAYYRAYRDFLNKHNGEVWIVDQGILQALVSIHHDDSIVDSRYLKSIFSFLSQKKIDITIVNCRCDVDISLQRIKSRKTSGGRLDVCDDFERLDILKTQELNFTTVRSAAYRDSNGRNQIDIRTKDLPQENALKIRNYLDLKEVL